MTVLLDIIARRIEDGSQLRRQAIDPKDAAKIIDAMVVMVESSEGGRVRHGKISQIDLARDATGTIPMTIAGTDMVSDAPLLPTSTVVVPVGAGHATDSPSNDLTAQTTDGYPASHFDNLSVCGAQKLDAHGTIRCSAIRGHKERRHTWRKVLSGT